MPYSLSQIVETTEAQTPRGVADFSIEHLLIDSRKIRFPERSLFIALRGKNHDGHAFVHAAYASGVRAFLVEHVIDDLPDDASLLVVKDTLAAFQKLVAWHRSLFQIPVIGITGSNGKTIVKEWLYQLLKEEADTIRSPKSYNSQVGVPLSVWQLAPHHKLAIFEAGISKPGEMQLLERMIQPQVGLFTNIGAAHDEGFANRADKIDEKLKLFTRSDLLVCPADDVLLLERIREFATKHTQLKLLTWSLSHQQADIFFETQLHAGYTVIRLRKNAQYIAVHIPYTDAASIQNACSCLALLVAINRLHADVLQRFSTLEPVEMRLRLKEGMNQCVLINDSYSADIQSLQIALDFMSQQGKGYSRMVILSDFFESGMPPERLYELIGQLLEQYRINYFIGIGEQLSKYAHCFKTPKRFYSHTELFLKSLHEVDVRNHIILIKGARAFQFERITDCLEKRKHETVFEINLNALVHNLNTYRSHLSQHTKIMAMVKAFSYGAGSYEIARVLEFHHVDYLAVAYADEGVHLREAGIQLPIMVMNVEISAMPIMMRYQLEPVLYSQSIMNEWLKQSEGEATSIHLELDTGMKRLGFTEQDIPWLVSNLTHQSQLKVNTIFAHLAASEEKKHDEFTRNQIRMFRQWSSELQQCVSYPILLHTLNSGGIARFPEAHFDMVRLGIGLYGIDPSQKWQKQLQQIGTLKTVISQLHSIGSHETVGYSRKGTVSRPSTIATVAIGYADGYNRKLGNGKGYMLVNGHKAHTIGSICMDMTMLDVTDISCREGDEVIVFGPELPVDEVAEKIGTIPYEVLTSISQRVKRVYDFE